MEDLGTSVLSLPRIPSTLFPRIGISHGRLRDFGSELTIGTSHGGLCRGLIFGDYRCIPITPSHFTGSTFFCFTETETELLLKICFA